MRKWYTTCSFSFRWMAYIFRTQASGIHLRRFCVHIELTLGLISERRKSWTVWVCSHFILLYQAANLGFIRFCRSRASNIRTLIISQHHRNKYFSIWVVSCFGNPGVVVYSFWLRVCVRVWWTSSHCSRTHAISVRIIYFRTNYFIFPARETRHRRLNSSSFNSVARCFCFSFEFPIFYSIFLCPIFGFHSSLKTFDAHHASK